MTTVDWRELQVEWDRQQQTYLPDREQRFAAMLDAVEAAVGSEPRILDLAGGTGSITLRALERFPGATSVVVDIDAALLAIARATFADDDRVRVVAADLAEPGWTEQLGTQPFDAVLTATALHWLRAEDVAKVYRDVAGVLRAGGVFANADHIPDAGLPGLSGALTALEESRQERAQAVPGAVDWDGWWDRLRTEPALADAVAEREAHFAGRGGSAHTESVNPADWHIAALRAAGFAEAGLIWRGLTDAAVVGVR
ncbi:MAG TPA: class I SAM-dependent methyltransferase [Mycobacteriales bacterium]|nr:class I SAM-dependent methyltransferase [Mycobacteriales bacterium]